MIRELYHNSTRSLRAYVDYTNKKFYIESYGIMIASLTKTKGGNFDYYFNPRYYSATTTRHQGYCYYAINHAKHLIADIGYNMTTAVVIAVSDIKNHCYTPKAKWLALYPQYC